MAGALSSRALPSSRAQRGDPVGRRDNWIAASLLLSRNHGADPPRPYPQVRSSTESQFSCAIRRSSVSE